MKPLPYTDQIKTFLIQYYGPENPKRAWIWLLTLMVFMWFPQSSRRWGGIGFCLVVVLYFVFGWLGSMMKDFTPGS